MLDHGDKIRDHFFNPRNAGSLAGANAVGEAGSLTGGDALKLMLKINPGSEVIEAARFLALGGSSAIASFSALTELIVGRTLASVQSLTEWDISDALDGLPPDQMHGPKLGRQAFSVAVAAFRGKRAVPTPDGPCAAAVPSAEALPAPVVQRRPSAQPPAAIGYAARQALGAAAATSLTHPLLAGRKLKPTSLSTGQTAGPTDALPAADIADADAAVIARIVEDMRPVFRHDGGDIELVKIEAGQIFVRLSGACASCMMAGQTLGGLRQRIIDKLGRPLRIIPVGQGRG